MNDLQTNLAMHLNTYFNNTQADLTQVTSPTLFISNIYLSNKGLTITLMIILIMMMIGLIESKSFSEVLRFGIFFGFLFNLIYFISSYYLPPIWIFIATVIAVVIGAAINEEDGKKGLESKGTDVGWVLDTNKQDEGEYIKLKKVDGNGKKENDNPREKVKKTEVGLWILFSYITLIPLVILGFLIKAALFILNSISSIVGCFF